MSRGKPNGIKGDTISEEAMIVSMAETFEALLSRRFYRSKERYSPKEAYEIFKREKGRRFNPRLTEIFLKNFSKFIEIRQTLVPKYN